MWLDGMMKHTLACDGLGLELSHMDLKDDDNLVEEALLYLLTNVDIEGTHDGCGHLIKHFHINRGHNVLKPQTLEEPFSCTWHILGSPSGLMDTLTYAYVGHLHP